MPDCPGIWVMQDFFIPGEREVGCFVFCAFFPAFVAVEPYFWVLPRPLRGVLSNPPEGEKYVGSFFNGGYFETFPGNVLTVSQQQRLSVVLPGSFHQLARVVFDRDRHVVPLQWEA